MFKHLRHTQQPSQHSEERCPNIDPAKRQQSSVGEASQLIAEI